MNYNINENYTTYNPLITYPITNNNSNYIFIYNTKYL